MLASQKGGMHGYQGVVPVGSMRSSPGLEDISTQVLPASSYPKNIFGDDLKRLHVQYVIELAVDNLPRFHDNHNAAAHRLLAFSTIFI